MTRARLLQASSLAALLALAACSSTKEDPDKNVRVQGGDEHVDRLHEKPFTAHFDALLARFLPRGEFLPGVDMVWAPIHSGVNATLYFMALRDKLPRYLNAKHEETFFIVSGDGTLDLAGGKSKHIEGGFVVRIPPGYAHGFTSSRTEPLVAIVVVAPTVNELLAYPSDRDLPDVNGWVYCEDVTLPNALATPRQDNFATAKFLDQSKQSTLQLAAVQRERIPDHKHKTHDETVIVFFQQGFGFLRLDDVVNPTEAIEVAHIPAGTIHSFEHRADGQVRAISLFTPGYDGKDREMIAETRELKAPPEYKKTHQDGDWIEGDLHMGAQPKRPQIQIGNDGSPR